MQTLKHHLLHETAEFYEYIHFISTCTSYFLQYVSDRILYRCRLTSNQPRDGSSHKVTFCNKYTCICIIKLFFKLFYHEFMFATVNPIMCTHLENLTKCFATCFCFDAKEESNQHNVYY